MECNNDSIRCPYLANLEIERIKLVYGKVDADKLVEGLMQYFSRFSAIPVFAFGILENIPKIGSCICILNVISVHGMLDPF